MLQRIAISFAVAATLCSPPGLFGATRDDGSEGREVVVNLFSMPLSFVENQGQFESGVFFEARAGGGAFYFCSDEIVCHFSKEPGGEYAPGSGDICPPGMGREKSGIAARSLLIKVRFVGANPDPGIAGADRLAYCSNYFHGNDPSAWVTGAPNYAAIEYEDIYPGIDLKYYGNGLALKYDFIVAPGADPSIIAVSYEGARNLSVTSDGELRAETDLGPIYERRPYAYQVIGGRKYRVEAGYSMVEPGVFSFELSDGYDTRYPLIIDPELSYSTYLGGSGWDYGYCIAVDGAGNSYLAGTTASSDFPMLGSYDNTHNGEDDVFVTKLSADGSSILYSTYIGGTAWESARSIAVDGSGNAYVTGLVNSDDFPRVGAYDNTLGGFADAFVLKLSPAGNSLLYSTFLGGSVGQEEGWGIAVDGSGSAYVTGSTNSSDFPTVNAYDPTYIGVDAFVTKFSPAGNSLVYSTFLGGTLSEKGYDIAVDGSGRAYVTGYTNSSDFPAVNAYDNTFNGVYDTFVTRFSSAGNTLEYSTYVGGSGLEEAHAIAVSGGGDAFVTGSTQSTDFPLVNAFDFARDGGSESFVFKLSSAGNTLLYSTYLGGIGGEDGWGIAVDGSGRAFVAGSTASSDFPMVDPYDGTINGGYDVFLTTLSAPGNSIVFSTFLGGNATDAAWDVALDGSGAAYLIGETWSSNFPTLNAYDNSINGSPDAFAAKFAANPPAVPTLSQWAVVVLILSLFAAATAGIVRRRNYRMVSAR